MVLALKSLITAVLAARTALAVGTAFGYATGTTGGGNLPPAIPSSPAQLATWLADNQARVILLDKTYDFTDLEGSAQGLACKPWTCGVGAQLAINHGGWCQREQPNAENTTVTYSKAGVTAIQVGSNKTLLGQGTAGWIKGKGIRISGGSSNIIIQNVRFSDINAQFVWGGDALTIDGGKNIWIDHNHFKNVGRQFIVTGGRPAEAVTISNNVFDGTTLYSTACNGQHWWSIYFTGTGDSITFAFNHIYKTAGRSPRIGGGGSQKVHMYNNRFVDTSDHALDADVGSKVLLEGNVYQGVKRPSIPGRPGIVFGPISPDAIIQCAKTIGRNCVANALITSGPLEGAASAAALSYFTEPNVKNAQVMDAMKASAYVQANAGTGKLQMGQ